MNAAHREQYLELAAAFRRLAVSYEANTAKPRRGAAAATLH